MKYWFNRIKYFLTHGKDDYGKSGFTTLTYRGLPVLLRDDMPVGFINEKTARVRILNWKTGKKGKLMTFKQFDKWIEKNKS